VEMPVPDAPQMGGLRATSESILLLFVFSSGLMICQERTVASFFGLEVFLSCFILSCF